MFSLFLASLLSLLLLPGVFVPAVVCVPAVAGVPVASVPAVAGIAVTNVPVDAGVPILSGVITYCTVLYCTNETY
jgi:hypothetical protein